jgi:hypothetical protein
MKIQMSTITPIAKIRGFAVRWLNPSRLWLGVLLILYALSYHGFTGSVIDETMPIGVTSQLVTAHTAQINPLQPALTAWGAPPADDHAPIYSKYAPGQSLLMVPIYALGTFIPLHSLTHAPDGQPFLPAAPVLLTYTLGSFLAVLTAFGVTRTTQALGYSAQTGAWIGLLYGVTTFAWPYAKTLYNEPSTACALIGAVYWSIRYRQTQQPRAGFLAGACFGLAILFRTTSVLYVPLAILYWWPSSWRQIRAMTVHWLWPSVGIASGVIITLAYNLYRFGNPFETGYEPGFGRAPWEALLGYILSPSRSLFLFAPVLLLALPGAVYLWRARTFARETLYLIGLAVIPIAIYSTWWAWDGGASLGPRFLLPSVPVAILLVAPLIGRPSQHGRRLWRITLIGLGVVGFLVQLLSNLPTTADVFGALSQGHPDLSGINWQWSQSLLANLGPVYMQREIDSVVMRTLPIHNALLLAIIFAVACTALVVIMTMAIARLKD